MKRLLFAALAGSLFVSSQALAQDDFRHLDWIGFKREGVGSPGCGITKQVIKDVWFFLYANKQGRFAIGVSSPLWNLMVGTRTPGSASFDGGKPIPLPGTLESVNTILFAGDANEFGLEERIKSSRNVRVSFEKSYLDVSLKGSSTAMKLLYECAENQIEPIEHDVIDASSQSEPVSTTEFMIDYLPIYPKMPVPRIIEARGLGTDDAQIIAKTGENELKAWCENWRPNDTLQECLKITDMEAERDRTFKASANCSTGFMKDVEGDVILFNGLEGIDPVWKGSFRFRYAETGEEIGMGNADGGTSIMQQWMALCPSGWPYGILDNSTKLDLHVLSKPPLKRLTYNNLPVLMDPALGVIVAEDPKAFGNADNTVVFRGSISSSGVTGFAYAYKQGCEPAPYVVSGFCDENCENGFGLTGKAPLWDQCEVVGYSNDAPGSMLDFKKASQPVEANLNQSTKSSRLPSAQTENTETPGADSTNAQKDAPSNAQTGTNRDSSIEPTQYRHPADYVPKGKAITLSSTDENAVKELVGLQLLDETSARFRNFAAAEFPDGTYTVCGFVNSKNQFGAYAGFTLFYSNYRPDTKTLTYFVMANNENVAGLCTLNGVVFQ